MLEWILVNPTAVIFTFLSGITAFCVSYIVAYRRGVAKAERQQEVNEYKQLAESLELKEDIRDEVEQSIINDDMQSRIDELRDVER